MRLFKHIVFNEINVILIIYAFIEPAYQQSMIATKKDFTFCIQNDSMSNTLQTFWHDANSDCEMESKRLIELYSQLVSRSKAKEEDKCSALLKHQMRKKLIKFVSAQLEEAFITQSITTNRELKLDLKELLEIDKRVTQVIWEKVVNEVYLFVESEKLINEIVQIKEQEIQIVALHVLLNKYLLDDQLSETLVPLLTFHTASLFKENKSSSLITKSFERLNRRLPKELRLLYESSQQTIGLLNYHHSEYLYAPRDNGPDSDRRLALTWTETKNSTDSDGYLSASFNDRGLVAFSNRFGASPKYLYADVEHRAAYFWIGSGSKSSQWWQVIWPHESLSRENAGYILFRNEDTNDLLCATTAYDENRRYVTLLNSKRNMENPACYWLLVTRF